eukprot:13266462-Alexandrium_andersonii.AAC.1
MNQPSPRTGMSNHRSWHTPQPIIQGTIYHMLRSRKGPMVGRQRHSSWRPNLARGTMAWLARMLGPERHAKRYRNLSTYMEA